MLLPKFPEPDCHPTISGQEKICHLRTFCLSSDTG
jgi:hypothetical protein